MEATEKQPDNLNMVGITVIGAAGSLLVYIIFVALQAFYAADTSELQAKRDADGIDLEYRNLLADQQTALNGYRWLDQSKRTVAFPVETAMDRVIEAAKADRGAALVPAVGAHDMPTVPAIPGRPADGAVAPAAPAPADGAAAPADGTAAPADGTAAPADGTAAPADGAATPTDGTQGAPATPAAGSAAPSSAPGAAPGAAAQPAATQPAAAQPAAAQPAVQPGAAKPGAAKPGAAKPGAARPPAAQPAAPAASPTQPPAPAAGAAEGNEQP